LSTKNLTPLSWAALQKRLNLSRGDQLSLQHALDFGAMERVEPVVISPWCIVIPIGGPHILICFDPNGRAIEAHDTMPFGQNNDVLASARAIYRDPAKAEAFIERHSRWLARREAAALAAACPVREQAAENGAALPGGSAQVGETAPTSATPTPRRL
jgi:hypothetical protein